MKRLTLAEAEELVLERLYGMGEVANEGTYEGTVFDCDQSEARDQTEAFIAMLNREIDRTSIEFIPDRLDEMDLPCIAVRIKIGGAA